MCVTFVPQSESDTRPSAVAPPPGSVRCQNSNDRATDLESRITLEWQRVRVLMEERAYDLARVAMGDAIRLMKLRTPEQIAALERARGLR